jgi:hypothetical protein
MIKNLKNIEEWTTWKKGPSIWYIYMVEILGHQIFLKDFHSYIPIAKIG